MFWQAPRLTKTRIRVAYAVAVSADLLQWMLGPFGWAFADEILDLLATVAVSALIGFHPLLLPTFALELFPVADMLPTWTACVALVVMLRRREQADPPPPIDGPVIDV